MCVVLVFCKEVKANGNDAKTDLETKDRQARGKAPKEEIEGKRADMGK